MEIIEEKHRRTLGFFLLSPRVWRSPPPGIDAVPSSSIIEMLGVIPCLGSLFQSLTFTAVVPSKEQHEEVDQGHQGDEIVQRA